MESLSAFLLPAVSDGSILLPTFGVAEIVNITTPRKLFGVPKWVYGFCMWRETEILVIDYQNLLSDTDLHRKKPLMVIKNSLKGSEFFGFLGILIDGAPQKVEISQNDLNNPEESIQQGRTWYHFEYLNQKIWVPPEESIENEIDTLFS